MAYTTPKAIIDGLYDLVKSLDPDGKAAGGGYEFEPRSGAVTWDDAPESDRDRRFTVEALTRNDVQMFGTIDEIDYGGTFQVHIMHNISKEERDGMVRRDADLYQIAEEMEKKANWATHFTAVSLIRFNNQQMRKLEKHWYTIMTFRINFTLAAP
jgi:ATP-dependent RNA circularization protein (DNA/RNA ligase family)